MVALSSKRIGYLRKLFRDGKGVSASAADKAMWRKLAKDGFVVEEETGFSRTAAGDAALAAFDAELSDDIRAILNAVRAKTSGVAVMKGIFKALDAGLVSFVEEGSTYSLTSDGERLADPIGQDGYFTKSGNLVKVFAVGPEGSLRVERLDGESKGKQMLIPREAFVLKAEWEAQFAD